MKKKSSLLLVLLLPVLMSAAAKPAPEFFPAQDAKNVNPDTHLVLTFPEAPTLGAKGFIRVWDAATNALVDELDLSIPAGPTMPRRYGPECDYTKVPYDYMREKMLTNRDVPAGTPSGGAQPDEIQYQLNIIGGFTDGFHFHPVIIHDNVATIYLHNNMLEYGHEYYVTIDKSVFKATGWSGIKKGAWKFSTKRAGPTDLTQLNVRADGRGDFNTLQGALDYTPDFSDKTIFITVAEGDYEEIVYCRNKSNLIIQGAGMDKSRVHYENDEVFNPHPLNIKTNEKRGTYPSRRAAVFFDNCRDIVLQDITFETCPKGQAEGLLLCGERIALYRVHIIGGGDALQSNGTVYMEDSVLDGGLDSILGRGSLFAYHCQIRNSGGAASWVRNFSPDHGDIFVECHFEGTGARPLSFSRSRGYPDAEFVLINCTTRNVSPIGWESFEKSAHAWEYNTRDADTGELADFSGRNENSRRLDPVADAEIIRNYSDPAYILNGWQPLRAPKVVELWPDGAPNDNGLTGEEYRNENFRITNVTVPTLTVYPAPHPNGQAVVACPGGGYRHLSFETEASWMAQWFNDQGITLAVLKYRMPNGHMECPISDIKRAMEVMHEHAAEWGVDPAKIGVQGNSAGGHLIAALSTGYDKPEQRPAFQIMFYGALTMEQGGLIEKVTAQTPPAFILCSQDDPISVDSSLQYMAALKNKRVPSSTLHIYAGGGHGWGFKDSFVYKEQWTSELAAWLREINN
jgi:acetyl esterase/lipase